MPQIVHTPTQYLRHPFVATSDIVALRLQKIDPVAAFFNSHPALNIAAVIKVVQIDHFADFRQAESDPLCSQNPCQPCPVPF